MGIEEYLPDNIITSSLDKIVSWGRKWSIWPVTFGLACCAIEMMTVATSRYDFDRLGLIFRSTPRQSDLIIVSGRVSYKMAPMVKRVYDQMPNPKWVIAMGDCACSGGLFNVYSIVQGVDRIIPVDVYIPGCPPRPEALLHGIVKLQEKIQKGTLKKEKPRVVLD